MPVTPVPVRRVFVYEVLNLTRMESLLALSGHELGEFRDRVRREPPASLERWDLRGDQISFEKLAARLPEEAAEQFVTLYLENMRQRTWRFHLWRD